MKYSVIVPVYNTFDYVEKIVAWFLHELSSRAQQDIELILVDDGSKQGPKYAIDSPAIKLFRKENGGVSSARNYGIERALGEFILFLDSDDSYEKGIFHHLDEVLAKNIELDSVLLSFRKISDSYVDKIENSQQTVTGEQALSLFLTKEIRLHICGFVISRTRLNEHRLRFDEALHFSEDVLFIIEYLALSNRCYISPISLYNHVLRSGSAINSQLTQKDTTHIDAFERIAQQAKKNAKLEEVNFFVSTCYINLIKFLVKNKTQDKVVFEKIVMNHQFLFGKVPIRLNKYTLVVLVSRLLFKLDSLCNYRALRKLSVTG